MNDLRTAAQQALEALYEETAWFGPTPKGAAAITALRAALAQQAEPVAEGLEKKNMTGKTCEKCKKDTYQERSLRDDWEGTLQCSCGHVVDRWRKYKKKDDEQGVAEGK